MTLPWKIWTRSLPPSTTRTWTFNSSPGKNWGMSSRSDWLSTRSVVFMASLSDQAPAQRSRRGLTRIRDGWELFQQVALLVRDPTAGRDQVGTGGERAVQRLSTPPSGDPAVVTAAQNVRDVPAAERGRTGVVRLFQQTGGAEALRQRAVRIAHRTGQQPSHRLDHKARRHLAAVQHEVADAQLAVDQMLADPVVNPLVASAEQAETGAAGELAHAPLVELTTTRPEQQQRPRRVRRLDRRE